MAQKKRSELKELFLKGKKPSQQDFADFIESTLNIKDDGIEKAGADTPLKITAQGDDEKLLEFLDKNGGSSWSISQKSGDKQGFNISNASGDSRLFIDSSSGNVGIGKVAPQSKLHIGSGDTTISKSRVDVVIATENVDAGIAIAQKQNDNSPPVNLMLQASGAGGYIGTTSEHSLTLRTQDTDRLIIDREGNVGIGKVAPQSKLHIGSGDTTISKSRVDVVIATENLHGGIAIAQKQIDNSPPVNLMLQASGFGAYIGTTSAHSLILRTQDTDRLIIDKEGQVFIGGYEQVTGNHTALHIHGTTTESPLILAENKGSGNIFYAKGEGTAYAQDSSIKLKKSIRSLQNSLDKILNLEGVRFIWKESNIEDIGFIAEEVGKQIPEAVTYGDDGYTTSMSYNHIIPFLVEAIKEQQKMINNLQETINSLSN